jgi:ankyrin repeat protein
MYGFTFTLSKHSKRGTNMSEQIIKAAADGDLETVKTLLEEGDDVNSRDNGRWSPLILAAQNGHLEVVKLLIKHRADINAENAYTETALCLAKSEGHREIVAILEQLGAKP